MPLSSVLGAQSITKPGVCTSTTRPSSPFDGQVIYETDTDRTLVWNNSAWVAVSYAVYTSSTRPSSPYEGQLIYETDTDRIVAYDGANWVGFDTISTSYTPTLTNVTIGNGLINGMYTRIGKLIFGGFHLAFGSTTSVTGLVGIGIPFTAATGANTRSCSIVGLADTGVNTFWGVGIIAESYTRIDLYAQNSSSTYSYVAATSSTVPHTWNNTDEMYGSFFYRAA